MIRRISTDQASRILLHPSIRRSVDDGNLVQSSHELIRVCLNAPGWYFLADGDPVRGANPGSVAVFIPVNEVTREFHFYALAGHRGDAALRVARDCIDWVFSNTPVSKLTTTISRHHEGPARHAIRLGFEVEGVSPRSALHGGVLCDRVFYGLEKERWTLCHG